MSKLQVLIITGLAASRFGDEVGAKSVPVVALRSSDDLIAVVGAIPEGETREATVTNTAILLETAPPIFLWPMMAYTLETKDVEADGATIEVIHEGDADEGDGE